MSKPCSAKGCDEDAECRSWCSAHYARWWRTGDPLPARKVTASTRRLPKMVHV